MKKTFLLVIVAVFTVGATPTKINAISHTAPVYMDGGAIEGLPSDSVKYNKLSDLNESLKQIAKKIHE